MRRIISWIPNSITCCNLVSGCMAMFMAMQRDPEWIWGGLTPLQWFYIFVLAAAVFDFLDGMSARLLKQYSPLGKELDSLSDLVSFGVAPGMLMINIMLGHGIVGVEPSMRWLAWAALAIPILGAIRLAKFNVDDSQSHTFKGLPIPANALFWIGFSGWIYEHPDCYPGNIVVALIVLFFASAMVWPLKMFSLKFKTFGFRANVKRYGILIAAILFVVFYGISGLGWSIILYILLSALSRRSDD